MRHFKLSIILEGETCIVVLEFSISVLIKYSSNSQKEFCKKIKNLPENQIENLRIRRNAVTGEPEIQCFMERLSEYLQVRRTS